MSSTFKKWILLIASLAISACGAEVVLKFVKPTIVPRRGIEELAPAYIAAYSDYLPFTLPPNVRYPHQTDEFNVVYAINPLGYRGTAPHTISKPSTIKRLLLLGDSFTLGWGNSFEQSYAGRLAQTLEPQNYEVINAAYKGGYSPDSYYAFLMKEGLLLQPDIVIVVIYTDNDIDDIQDNTWIKTNKDGAPLVIRTLRNYANYRGEIIKVKHHELPWNYETPFLNESRLFLGVTDLLIHKPKPLPFHLATRRFEQSIQALQYACQQQQLPLLFFLIPRKNYQPRADHDKHKVIRSILLDNQSIFYDLSEQLSFNNYYNYDAHLNPSGNAIVYEYILGILYSTYIH